MAWSITAAPERSTLDSHVVRDEWVSTHAQAGVATGKSEGEQERRDATRGLHCPTSTYPTGTEGTTF